MTDEMDKLKAAMTRATPAPNPKIRDAHLRLAQENFDRLQGSATAARPTVSRPPWARLTKGASTMLNVLSTKGGLAATTAIVAVGLVMVVPQGRDLLRPTTEFLVPAERAIDKTAPNAPLGGRTETNIAAPGNETAGASSQVTATGKLEGPAPVTSNGPARQDRETTIVGDADDSRFREQEAAPAQGQMAGKRIAQPPALVQSEEAESFASGDFADRVEGDTLSMEEPMLVQPAPSTVPMAESRRVAVPDMIAPEEPNTEAFSNAATNPIKVTTAEPVSTFSIDVDTASYAIVRSSLTAGQMPPPEAVRIEEMVNYFPYAYPAPDGPHPFQPTVTVLPSPWNAGTSLVHIGIQGTPPETDTAPPLNLVFLIDTSGSMQDADKLPLLKQSFRLMLSQLRPQDEVAIVTYAGSAGQVLEPTPASEEGTILAALDRLQAGGSTAGQAGLQQAYATAEAMANDGDDGEVTRVILATDGDFNVGISNPEALKDFIAEKRDSGTYLSVLGFGRGNLDDATMQALAQNGNGQASYIDTLSEAQKVLVDQLGGALFPIAGDVKIQVEFNPAQIAEYRLLGYETRGLAREDFNNDKVDAGDIGAGHTVTAIYEVTPVGSPAILNSPLRYAADDAAAGSADPSGELGYLKLRYKAPGSSVSTLIETPIQPGAGEIGEDVRFSAAIAGFGQLLRGGDYLGDWNYDDAIALATSARGPDLFGYRSEAVQLMRLAETMDR